MANIHLKPCTIDEMCDTKLENVFAKGCLLKYQCIFLSSTDLEFFASVDFAISSKSAEDA